MYIEIIGFIVIVLAIRILITKNRAERLLYINAIDFAVSALIALYINTPFGLVLAVIFFICSTISSNALAYSLKPLNNEIIVEK